MIPTVVVGHGLAGRAFHCPLIRRQPGLVLHGIVARDPRVRERGAGPLGRRRPGLCRPRRSPGRSRGRTRGDRHAPRLARGPGRQRLDAGRHCVVDKVMALTTLEADRMIAARDRSGRMLSVFHNRRWDLGLRDSQGAHRPRRDRSAAAFRELRLPGRSASRLARPLGSRRDDPLRLGRPPGRPGPPARPGTLPTIVRLVEPEPLGGRR